MKRWECPELNEVQEDKLYREYIGEDLDSCPCNEDEKS